MRTIMTLLLLALTACGTEPSTPSNDVATTPAPAAESLQAEPASPALRAALEQDAPMQCTSNEDCVVKDVGSCCGYNPQCVHKDQKVDPEAVQAKCKEEGRVSICGFQEPQGCECVANQCKGIYGAPVQ